MVARPQARPRGLSPVDLLAGRWSVRRDVCDHRLGLRGAFTGVAVFTRTDAGLTWSERGHMRFSAYDGPAFRDLVVVAAGDGWEVRFPDGRLFHPLDLSTGVCDAVHPCGEDVYRGRYVLETPDRLTVAWRVSGPEADESLDAVYDRATVS